MRLTVNSESCEFSDVCTVFDLLERLDLLGQYVAVECNCSIVPYKMFRLVRLCDGDVIELVTLVGGG
jgi:thiamine biosynthesis protein ThiS